MGGEKDGWMGKREKERKESGRQIDTLVDRHIKRQTDRQR